MIQFYSTLVSFTVMSASVLLIFKLHYWFSLARLYFTPTDHLSSSEYDFIIVGAGSAGSILAARLAENPRHQILLLEAGAYSSFLHNIPIFTPILQATDIVWPYKTTPQKDACKSLENHASKWPTGKILGGSSRLNFNVYLRGHRRDFDSWSPPNSSDWSYDDLLVYFKKTENQKGRFKESHAHGVNGPIVVSDMPFVTGFSDSLLEAGKEIGFDNRDINEFGSGFMETQVTVNNGARWSSEEALTRNSKTFKNIHVFPNAFVEKVLIRDGFEAYGVQFKFNGITHRSFVKKSVILSAGAIGSAKLLMLSGIGPKSHLESLKIPVVADLPVGKNLQDHIMTGLDMVTMDKSLGTGLMDLFNPMNLYNYFINGKGLWSSPGCETVGIVYSSDTIDQDRNPPDLQFMSIIGGVSSDAGSVFRKIMGFSNEFWEDYMSLMTPLNVISLCPALLHPKSRGFIQLRSSDPLDPPVINPQYFSHKDDVDVLVRGMKLLEKLTKTQSLRRDYGTQINRNKVPGCQDLDFGSNDYWECYVRHVTMTVYHPAGTCRMGDSDNVVDYSLKVKGVQSLFVVDASVMPTLPSANPNAVVMAIAEKAADMLKWYWYSHFCLCRTLDLFLPPPKFTKVKLLR